MPVSKGESDFVGKKIFVTGAGRGIGRAVAVELYEQGATIFALSKNPDNLKSLKEECPNVHTICVDLSNWEETKKRVENEVDYVDALINNAGVCIRGHLMEITSEGFDQMFNVNLKSVINVSQIIAKKMIERGKGGSIVNISSVASKKAFPDCTVYCCTKAALNMLTKTMAIQLGEHKITVNSICPAAVDTDMLRSVMEDGSSSGKKEVDALKKLEESTPTKTLFMPMSEVVNTIAFFASGVTGQITGETIAIDGGYCVT